MIRSLTISTTSLLLVLISLSLSAQTAKVIVSISNFDGNSGQATLRLYSSENGFPLDQAKAYTIKHVPINKHIAKLVVDKLPAGEYAIMAYHDKNSNGEIDRNFVGFPQERLAISNYPSLRKPSFEKAKFQLKAGESLRLEMKVDTPF